MEKVNGGERQRESGMANHRPLTCGTDGSSSKSTSMPVGTWWSRMPAGSCFAAASSGAVPYVHARRKWFSAATARNASIVARRASIDKTGHPTGLYGFYPVGSPHRSCHANSTESVANMSLRTGLNWLLSHMLGASTHDMPSDNSADLHWVLRPRRAPSDELL